MVIKNQIVQFIVMFLVALFLNPMNLLANNLHDIYFSLTSFYSALLMASNMIWSHQIVHYLNYKSFNKNVFIFGVILSFTLFFFLRYQKGVSSSQWLKRMIGHHSTALTTTKKLLENPNNFYQNPKLYRLAKDIIYSQQREIIFMKKFLFG